MGLIMSTTIKLYHRDVFFPEGVLSSYVDYQWNLAYTRHALREAVQDKLGTLTHAPRSVRFIDDEVIEIETTNGAVTKLVIRTQYDDRRDLILVLRNMQDGAATVITLWTNAVDDNHNTLDKSKYATE